MKNLLFAMVLIVSPVFAAEDALNLTAEQKLLCATQGGCYLISNESMMTALKKAWEKGHQRATDAARDAIDECHWRPA